MAAKALTIHPGWKVQVDARTMLAALEDAEPTPFIDFLTDLLVQIVNGETVTLVAIGGE